MLNFNHKFLSEISSSQNHIKETDLLINGFSSYCVTPITNNFIKKLFAESNYLILQNNYDSRFDINSILNSISSHEQKKNIGYTYFCVMSVDNPDINMCTHLNGMSFVHFVFVDTKNKSLMYDKDIHYSGVKKFYEWIDICQKYIHELDS